MAVKLPQAFGAYVLLKSLGQGAMGDVHLAKPYNPRRGIPTPIVIKRLHGELASNEDFVRRFKHEAEIAVSVDSKSVAKVYDVGQVGETLYITMEFVPGWPCSRFIESVVQSGRHASISAIVDLLAGGLQGLEALHTARDIRTGKPLGIVHRDISPKNLMVGEDGLMRLIDLGLGKSNVQDWKTRTGVVMGSVGYMPPEQVTAEKIDHRADLYAMGAVLFELLALRHYITRAPIPVMLRNSVAPTFEPPSKFRPDVPPALDAIVKKSLSLDPADRYQSAREFLDAIRAVVPERRSQGGMATLINELFGSQLPERKAELSQLLALPMPISEDDGPEPERTIVFVQASGVAPLTEGDMPPTRVQVRDQGGVMVSPAPMPMPMVTPMPPHGSNPGFVMGGTQVHPMAEPGIVPLQSYSNFVTPPRAGVSVGVMVAGMLAAVLTTVAIMRVFSGDSARTVLPADVEPAPTAVILAPSPSAAPVIGATPASPSPSPSTTVVLASPSPSPSQGGRPERGSEPVRRPRSEPSQSPSEVTRPATSPATPTNEPERPIEYSDAQVQELFKQINELYAQIDKSGDDAKKGQASQLLSRAAMDFRQTDRGRAMRQLQVIERDMRALTH
ncbi:MAG: serine/threonine-protein kinase [Myxococcota bacterium]